MELKVVFASFCNVVNHIKMLNNKRKFCSAAPTLETRGLYLTKMTKNKSTRSKWAVTFCIVHLRVSVYYIRSGCQMIRHPHTFLNYFCQLLWQCNMTNAFRERLFEYPRCYPHIQTIIACHPCLCDSTLFTTPMTVAVAVFGTAMNTINTAGQKNLFFSSIIQPSEVMAYSVILQTCCSVMISWNHTPLVSITQGCGLLVCNQFIFCFQVTSSWGEWKQNGFCLLCYLIAILTSPLHSATPPTFPFLYFPLFTPLSFLSRSCFSSSYCQSVKHCPLSHILVSRLLPRVAGGWQKAIPLIKF